MIIARSLRMRTILLLCFVPGLYADSTDPFVHTTTNLSEARHSLTVTLLDGKAFFAGGSGFDWAGGGQVLCDTVDIYDSRTDRWSVSSLSQARTALASASCMNQAFFAGGYFYYGKPMSNVVDIYDCTTDTWTVDYLSVGRQSLAATSNMNKVFFAGGLAGDYVRSVKSSDVVDIYDTKAGTWSVEHLSQARYDIAAASVGNKVLFAGGTTTDPVTSSVVDIYDIDTGIWSTATLSQSRTHSCTVVADEKVFFAGGASPGEFCDVIDVYDAQLNQWSALTLPSKRTGMAAASTGDYILFGGGVSVPFNGIFSDRLDIYDIRNNLWISGDALGSPRTALVATLLDNKIFFAGGINMVLPVSTVDIYTIPEPTTLSLLAFGFSVLLSRKRV